MKITKAILTGGGRATRLRPLTSTINKHLIPLANKPMIFHAIQKAVDAGIQEIYINTNPGETDLQKYVGNGGRWGVKIHFFEQKGGPQGIAHVVKQAEKFIGDDPFMFYLSDNIIFGSLKEHCDEFCDSENDCMLALSEVSNAKSFGVPIFDENKKLVDVLEKPVAPPNNYAVTGIYLYGPKLFFKVFDNIGKSARGEYEISSIHSYLLKNNYKVGYKEITGWWKDTGQPHDLIAANQMLLKEMKAEQFTIEGGMENINGISGNVHIGVGAKIGKNVKINGPVIIGENCQLEDCVIHPHTTIGSGCVIKGAEIGDSIMLGNSRIECPLKIFNSIIGEKVFIRRHLKNLHRMVVGDNTVLEL